MAFNITYHSSIMAFNSGGWPSEVRVLIVEDHWANRRLLEAMLKKLGAFYTVCPLTLNPSGSYP